MYLIRFSSQSYNFLNDITHKSRSRIFAKIEKLKENPVPRGAIRIKGTKEEIFRIRVGDYRILYEVDTEVKIIGIIKIGKRSNIY